MPEKDKANEHYDAVKTKSFHRKQYGKKGTPKTYDPVAELKGLGHGVFGDSLNYRKKLWEDREQT